MAGVRGGNGALRGLILSGWGSARTSLIYNAGSVRKCPADLPPWPDSRRFRTVYPQSSAFQTRIAFFPNPSQDRSRLRRFRRQKAFFPGESRKCAEGCKISSLSQRINMLSRMFFNSRTFPFQPYFLNTSKTSSLNVFTFLLYFMLFISMKCRIRNSKSAPRSLKGGIMMQAREILLRI